MGFLYPNLLSGTRSGTGWSRNGGGTGGYSPDTGITLYNTKSAECTLWSPSVVLHKGRTYTLSFFAASTANMSGSDAFVLDSDGFSDSYQWVGAAKYLINPPVGGAWTTWTFSLSADARDGAEFYVRFDNNGSTDGGNSLVWFRDVMLVDGTTARAWAPAAVEVWP